MRDWNGEFFVQSDFGPTFGEAQEGRSCLHPIDKAIVTKKANTILRDALNEAPRVWEEKLDDECGGEGDGLWEEHEHKFAGDARKARLVAIEKVEGKR